MKSSSCRFEQFSPPPLFSANPGFLILIFRKPGRIYLCRGWKIPKSMIASGGANYALDTIRTRGTQDRRLHGAQDEL